MEFSIIKTHALVHLMMVVIYVKKSNGTRKKVAPLWQSDAWQIYGERFIQDSYLIRKGLTISL